MNDNGSTLINPEKIAFGNFDKAINLAKKQAEHFKNNPVRAGKYVRMQKELESTKSKLEEAIAKTKNLTLSSNKTFFEEFIEGKESAVTLAWLGAKLEEKDAEITSGDKDIDTTATEVDVQYDFVDRTKKAGKDLLEGKGLANGLLKTCLGVGICELLSKGVTSHLAKKGIMEASTGLLGLAKLGIKNLPNAFSAISSGMTALWGFSPLLIGVGGALIVLKAVPAIQNLINKCKAKYNANHNFENEIQNLVNDQATLA